MLSISARSADRRQAEALANVTAEELIIELGGKNSPFQTLERAAASPVDDDDIKGPTSRPGRAAMLGGVGLLLGAGAAILVDGFDNRIRSKQAAEAALGVPVLTEVPSLPPADRGSLVTGDQPTVFIEAYRRLRTNVDRTMRRTAAGEGGAVIVVTSPTGAEGTTTTVAQLAAALAEIGQSVLAVSADLRGASLHHFFDRPIEPGLVDILQGRVALEDLQLGTPVNGVDLLSSGTPVENPAPLLDRVGEVLRAARTLADVVLVDAPPLLTFSDAAEFARHADAVLLIVRTGHTTTGAATRGVELLQRLNIPVLGAVLLGRGPSVFGRRAAKTQLL